MRRFANYVLAAAIMTMPAVAGATTGGPLTLELLGYAPRDGKAYFLEHNHDSSDANPQLVYMPLRGASAGRLVYVQSWYVDDDGSDEFEERLTVRIDKLKARLRQPKRRAPTVHMSTHADGVTKWTSDWDSELTATGRRIRVDLATPGGDKSGSAVVESYGCMESDRGCPHVRVVRRAALPQADAIVVIVESLALPEEGGYTDQAAILVR